RAAGRADRGCPGGARGLGRRLPPPPAPRAGTPPRSGRPRTPGAPPGRAARASPARAPPGPTTPRRGGAAHPPIRGAAPRPPPGSGHGTRRPAAAPPATRPGRRRRANAWRPSLLVRLGVEQPRAGEDRLRALEGRGRRRVFTDRA